MAAEAQGAALAAPSGDRHDFSAIRTAIPIPNLIDVQRDSYARFLQMDKLPGEREETGLQAVFKSVFPIRDFREMSELDFVEYTIGDWECKCGYLRGLMHLRTRCMHCRATIESDPKGPPELLCRRCGRLTENSVTFCQKCGDPVGLKLKYEVDECQERGMNFAAPLKATINLTVYEKDAGAEKTVRDIKEQEVFFGEIPLMTERGTFIISGTERVVVSQLHRSPGVFFESANNRTYFLGKIIPYRGSWVEFEYDHKNLLQVRIDRKRKFLGTIFLRALGLREDKDILRQFYKVDTIRVGEGAELFRRVSDNLRGTALSHEVSQGGRVIARKGRKVTPRLLQQFREAGIAWLPSSPADLEGAVFAEDIAFQGAEEAIPDRRVRAALEQALPETERKRKLAQDARGALEQRLRAVSLDALRTIWRAWSARFPGAEGQDLSAPAHPDLRQADLDGLLAGVGWSRSKDYEGSRRAFVQALESQFDKANRPSSEFWNELSMWVQDGLTAAFLGQLPQLRTAGDGEAGQAPPAQDPAEAAAFPLRAVDLAWFAGLVLGKLKDASISPGELLAEANGFVSPDALDSVADAGIAEFGVVFPEEDECGVILSETLRKDSIRTQDEALLEIYRKLRPGDPPTRETAWDLFQGMFFDSRKYDFSRVGRMKFNIKLHGAQDATPLERRTLDADDFFATIDYLFKLRRSIGEVDDIDHLGNRRVRAVGELLENQFRIGLIRMERAMKERMTIYQDMASAMPHDLINAKPVMAAVREFFGSSQLSQFMDQINPLSEVTHKRRLSALGPGGLSRERAGFDVRDVHTTHYGRICPIETPEGPNIGLISSLSCFARINEYGFIESPYRRVENGRIVNEVRIVYGGATGLSQGAIVRLQDAEAANAALAEGQAAAQWETHCSYLSAWEEDQYVIAQANIPVDANGNIARDFANCRVAGDFQLKQKAEIQYLDVSPKQLVSVAASLIPFLENDDANRALMGSNMQRQAVPLLRADSPIVGTGMERITARDSGAVVLCKRDGTVDSVDSERIIVRVTDPGHAGQMSREVGADIYQLVKFRRSNQNTCINQKPIVKVGDEVRKGQVLADGPCTAQGELALGRNVLAAFMPWRGYNFEDAILVSEKLVKDDYYTSLHVEEFEIEARETKLGPEEITPDIPNIAESFLRNLDESGIIRIGSTVGPDDILVGKVVPKGDMQLTPEEKLLRAIFGDKAGDVKDASLRCPPGIAGTVVDAQVFSRKGVEMDARAQAIKAEQIERLQRNLDDEKRILFDARVSQLEALMGGCTVSSDLHDEKTNKRLARAGEQLGPDHFGSMRARDLKRLRLAEEVPDLDRTIDHIEDLTIRQINVLEQLNNERIAKLQKGDELPPGVNKKVKVFVAMKRKLSAGDKMAGRHGNKGVIARVLPEEDMPFLPDGTPVEIVLSPLGVPSRMNVGQILETHLGWAGHKLGIKYAAQVFEGPRDKDIKQQLAAAGLPTSGKTVLYDGLTGSPFEQEVTVGIIYMLKLSHLVDDKIHARSIGPYSLITQQPLGGKAQFGGQRFGEMEVWALEAYGAAHILQELLTAKSDDVYGRAKIYESIVKGESAMQPGVPESFNVLIRELQSLCLDVELVKPQQDAIETALAAD